MTGGESRLGLTTTSLTLFVGVEFIATVQVGDLRPLHRLMRECETDDAVREDVFRDGADGVVLAIFGRVLDIFEAARARVERSIGPEIEALFEHAGRRVRLETVAMASRLRLEVRTIRLLALSLRETLHQAERETMKPGATSVPWNQIQGRVDRLVRGVEDDLLGLDGLDSAADALTTFETARERRVLTSIAGLTLPVMAVAAVLSMPGVNPLMTATNGYAYALAVVGAVFLAALFILQRRGNL
jgi:magnesium transporter